MTLVKFESENFALRSKGPSARYEYSVLQAVVRDMVVKYGHWQNSECQDMKATMEGLAGREQSGLVPYSKFKGEPNHAAYQFSETAEDLEKLGALKRDGDGKDPKVRIANYLLGPTNCIASSDYYMICCLSECDEIVSEVETRTQSPLVTPDVLIGVVQEVSTSSLQAPHALSEAVAASLRDVAKHYEGQVPLHSAEYRQWLNAAFPNECPYLTPPELAAQESELRVANHWLQGQHVCSRLPEWHPSIVASHVNAIGEVEAEVAVEV